MGAFIEPAARSTTSLEPKGSIETIWARWRGPTANEPAGEDQLLGKLAQTMVVRCQGRHPILGASRANAYNNKQRMELIAGRGCLCMLLIPPGACGHR